MSMRTTISSLVFLSLCGAATAQDAPPPKNCSDMAACQQWCNAHRVRGHRHELLSRKFSICDQADAAFYEEHGIPATVDNYVPPRPHP